MVVQWLRLHAPTAGGRGSIPGRGTKIPHAASGSQKIKTKNFSRNTDTTLQTQHCKLIRLQFEK